MLERILDALIAAVTGGAIEIVRVKQSGSPVR